MTLSQAERVKRYYDENTQPFYLRCWDDTHLHFGLYREHTQRKAAIDAMNRAVIEPAGCGPEHHVVDAGCGVGGIAINLARKTGCRVTGFTLSPVQKAVADERAKAAGVADRVDIQIADCATRLPLESQSVDVVLTMESACHFADKPQFVAECARVLAPGGAFAGSDWMAAEPEKPGRDQALRELRSAWHLADLPTLSAWECLLTTAGFLVGDTEDFGEDVLENARVAKRATLELMLENANNRFAADQVDMWVRQYESLGNCWLDRHFTIGRFFATLA